MKNRTVVMVILSVLAMQGFASTTSLKRIDDAHIAQLPSSGKVVVLNFWATWCAPCREEIPALNRLHEKYPDVHLIGVNVDDPENEGALSGFLKKYPIRYETLRRAGSNFEATAASLDPQWKGGIPATFVFVDGKRIFSKIGKIEESELDRILNTTR